MFSADQRRTNTSPRTVTSFRNACITPRESTSLADLSFALLNGNDDSSSGYGARPFCGHRSWSAKRSRPARNSVRSWMTMLPPGAPREPARRHAGPHRRDGSALLHAAEERQDDRRLGQCCIEGVRGLATTERAGAAARGARPWASWGSTHLRSSCAGLLWSGPAVSDELYGRLTSRRGRHARSRGRRERRHRDRA